jgi:hypothetical protein
MQRGTSRHQNREAMIADSLIPAFTADSAASKAQQFLESNGLTGGDIDAPARKPRRARPWRQ